MPITVSGLNIYPVKGLKGIPLSSSPLLAEGLAFDRRFMLVDKNNRFLTQREFPAMCLLETSLFLAEPTLIVKRPDQRVLQIPYALGQETLGRETISVKVWQSQVDALDCGKDAFEFFSQYLGVPCRLVQVYAKTQRAIDPDYALSPKDRVGFADGFPVLVASMDSLDDLNSKMEAPLDINRFRANITISGAAPFAEESWKEIAINDTRIALVKPCARCQVTTVDQETAETGKEPLRTLSFYRKQNGKIIFGMNGIPVQNGTIQIGDRVSTL
ncbi:MAG: MOSC domain-containing protein [Candidatus Melainabacteria bacterium]|jgi:uncharacterized protein YcbX|nr:MOSC domain-containing protein [Candidatus Melainabacteria bacterium]MBX9672192.1 MOSC domain-containing protein [Candidatus Obscuribacterales bacterium]